jgi:hypothetical protein
MAPVSSSCALEVEYKYTGKIPGSHGLEKQKQKKPRKNPVDIPYKGTSDESPGDVNVFGCKISCEST